MKTPTNLKTKFKRYLGWKDEFYYITFKNLWNGANNINFTWFGNNTCWWINSVSNQRKRAKMTTKEEITERLDRLFARLKEYPLSQAIADAIDKNLKLLAELEESEQ